MQRLLIIEDNIDVNHLLRETLEAEGYEVESAYDGHSGMNALKKGGTDLLLLDLMLPYVSGDQILKELRSFSTIPVLILSAKDTVITKIDLLKLGADDYMTKPFDLGEVAVRVETLLRRVKRQEEKEQILRFKDIEMYEQQKKVSVKGKEIELTTKEYQILNLLMNNPKKVFSKANIYESLWKEEYLGDDNTIKAHLSKLRSKLKKAGPEEEYIETLWGFGYRLKQ